ncbi:hypothetical protein [Micromonospora sp. NPDC049679]|uniref:hypothetical protein n=1 Tax=Micromonospora sp. NPDC049679 TaxID=3155920 RepID=UPI0033FC5A83
MSVDPTLPLPSGGAGGTAGPGGQVPPPADPWTVPAPLPAGFPPAAPPPAAPPPATSGAGWYPPVSGGGGDPFIGPVVAQIGEIGVTSSLARTPAGDIPLAGSTWHVADYWQSEQKTPTWAVVMAILGFCVVTILSLLFLLVKQTIHRGTVQVTVTNGTRQYVARIPVTTQAQVQHIHQQVNYVRSLAAL